ncbi:MAG: acetate--CoA ligase family protein [Anaerolineaceae bacterium]|nr:acetate--CoA ligase family protein [Anaerolineaceae bacterium]
MDKIFYPKSIVVVGVSESSSNLAKVIAENIIRLGYTGKLFLLGRSAGKINDYEIYDSFNDLPDAIDLAIILTPAATVPGYMEECGRKGIKFAIIESGGFAEFSEEGRMLGEQILAIAHQYGMRFVGPNCIGIINTENGICSVFLKVESDEIRPGKLALLAQSGGVILTCADVLAGGGVGICKTVSVGNKIDLSETDFLEYFLQDKATDQIVLYLESIANGRGLVDLARQAEKPIIVYKSNTGQASAHIAHSHTAALANDEQIVNAAFKQFGIFRAKTFGEMVNMAKGFSMPAVKGNKLAVFSRSGGHAIVSADLASEFGFDLPPYPQEVYERARDFVRAAIIDENNPLDLGTVFNFDSYPILIEECLRKMQPDAVMLVFNYRREAIATARSIAEKLKTMSQTYDTPIALVYFTETDEISWLEKNLGYPVFAEVYDAIHALAVSREHAEHRRKQKEADGHAQEIAKNLVPMDAARQAAKLIAGAEGRPLMIHEALQIIQSYGIEAAAWRFAEDLEGAVQAADQLGYPLVLKIVSAEISHKSDLGGVVLNLKNSQEVRQAILNMQQRMHNQASDAAIAGFLVQKMAGGGREVILGGKRDSSFGPVVLFGMGGVFVEVFKDAALRLAPITPADAESMIHELRGSRMLEGVRGQAPADIQAIEDNLLRLSQMMVDLPEIEEIDINPLMSFERGGLAVDARIVVKGETDRNG